MIIGTPTEAECPSGGATVQVEGAAPSTKKPICNGEDAEGGGFPKTLPVGATETGAWSLQIDEAINEEEETGQGRTTISFPIPMLEEGALADTKIVNVGGTPPAECENPDHAGAASAANPEATSGFLCVYAINPGGGGVNPSFIVKAASAGTGYSVSGAVIAALGAPAGAYGQGTWAITG